MNTAEQLETIYFSAVKANGTFEGVLGQAEKLSSGKHKVTTKDGVSVIIGRDPESLDEYWKVGRDNKGIPVNAQKGSGELVYVIQECLT